MDLSGFEDTPSIPEHLLTSSISHLSCSITLLKALQHRSWSWWTKSEYHNPGRVSGCTFVISQRRPVFLPQILPAGSVHSPSTAAGLGLTCFLLVWTQVHYLSSRKGAVGVKQRAREMTTNTDLV